MAPCAKQYTGAFTYTTITGMKMEIVNKLNIYIYIVFVVPIKSVLEQNNNKKKKKKKKKKKHALKLRLINKIFKQFNMSLEGHNHFIILMLVIW